MLEGNLSRTATLDRLVKLFASGRVTVRRYEWLVRAMCHPADQEQSTSDQAEAEHQLAVGLAGIETYRNALTELAKR